MNVAVASVRAAHDRGELGPTARAAAVGLIGRVVIREIPVSHATDAAVLVGVLVDIARLEDNQPTHTALVGHVSTADLLARLRDLQRERPGAPHLSHSPSLALAELLERSNQ